jgi:alkylation response protein AidB-like acyl-CoA dehydrogenase
MTGDQMLSKLVDERDLKFVLFDLLGIQDLALNKRFEHIDQETLEMLIDEALKFSEQYLFALNLEGDKVGASFEDGHVRAVPGTREAYQEFVQCGWLTQSEDPELGGQGLPEIIKFATHEMFLAANFPFMCFVNLTHDAAKLIELFGDDGQKTNYLEKMYGGDWTGTMALTESGAGSDVGAIKARARLVDDGSYRLQGQKIYITNGDHDISENIVHLVLARIEGDPDGTRGLSIFIVPKFRLNADGTPAQRNDVTCTGIEHKMGLHASPTTSLSFGDSNDCHAYLLGQPREGIKIMFHMMNQSRLEVGLFGLGICSVSYRHALAYARERLQGQSLDGGAGQVAIVNHPDIRRTLMTMKAITEGLRAMLYYCGYAMDRAEVAKDEDEQKKWQGIVDLLIPIAKARATERGVRVSSLALRIYGGAGYTCDHPIEQFMRDAKVACIFEGTTGIQGIDFAIRKVPMKGGSVFRDFLGSMDEVIDQAHTLPNWGSYADQLRKTRDALAGLPERLAKGDADSRLRNQLMTATPFLEAAGDTFIGYFLLWSAMVAENKIAAKGGLPENPEELADSLNRDPELAFLAGKINSARFYIAGILPEVEGKIAGMGRREPSACTMADASF